MFTYTPMFTDALVFSCNERTNEGLVVEVTFSYSSYKLPKFNANFLTLSSSAAGPYFPLWQISHERRPVGNPS